MFEKLISFGLPLLSIGISLMTFYFTVWSRRAKLDVNFTGRPREMKPDRWDSTYPDTYIFDDYRFFVDISITNESSLPITITEFQVDSFANVRYSDATGDHYKVTVPNNNPGLVGSTIEIVYDFNSVPKLIPPIVIEPYSVHLGTLVFRYDSPLPDNVKLKIITSRKTFIKKIEVSLRSYSELQTNYLRPQVNKSFLDL
ncbi:hypothetical protein IGI72_002475 [Enterococcus sp. DIV1059_2]